MSGDPDSSQHHRRWRPPGERPSYSTRNARLRPAGRGFGSLAVGGPSSRGGCKLCRLWRALTHGSRRVGRPGVLSSSCCNIVSPPPARGEIWWC